MPIILRSFGVLFFLALVLCGFYPLAVTGLGNLFFADLAQGQIIERDGKAVGSVLIGQNFSSPIYFHARPSKAGNGYDATASSGSNFGVSDPRLKTEIASRAQNLLTLNPDLHSDTLPADLLTASASGLDPHISVKAANAQAARIAKARKTSVEDILDLIAQRTESASLGIFGQERINVLLLNLDLNQLQNKRTAP